MNFKFRDWFFEQFPDAIQDSDSYRDSNNEGLLKRFLRGEGMELDEEIVPYIESFTNIIDLNTTDDKFLYHIASLFGMPPSPFGIPLYYRRLLRRIIAIYKVKGTAESFIIAFNIVGMSVTLVEATPKKRYTYDQPVIYDNPNPNKYIYDSQCENCTDFWVGYAANTVHPHVYTTITQDMLDEMQKIICFLTPINAKFQGYIPMVEVHETVSTNITETHNP